MPAPETVEAEAVTKLERTAEIIAEPVLEAATETVEESKEEIDSTK